MSKEILTQLKDDDQYYHGIGKNYLSNSDISALLGNPKEFRLNREDNVNFAKGRLFHHMLIELNKVDEWTTIDVSSRNTKAYNEALIEMDVPFLLLKKEYDEVEGLAQTMKSNIHLFESIYADDSRYEVPNLGEIQGFMWKGKADIERDDILIDLKTTADIKKFQWSARSYNYDSQAYIYQQLFGKPLVFYVIDKTTSQLGVFEPSEDFISRGQHKVSEAIKVYERFFKEDSVESIDDYYTHDILL